MKNKVAIIIVTYNGSRWIRKCLASVFRNEYDGGYDVIVVDNASTDGSADIVEQEFPEVAVIRSAKNLGFAGGSNLGIKEALRHIYEYILMLNQDTEVEPNFLSEIVRVASPDDVGIVQGMLVLGDERSLTNNAGNALHYLGFGFVKHYREPLEQWANREPFEIGYASGAVLLVKRSVLEEVGILDEKFFMYHEDLDLCWRARLAGYRIMLAPAAVAYHYYQFNRNKEMFYWTDRNRWAALLQNYSVKSLILLGPMLVAIEILMLLYSLVGGWFGKKLKSYAWVIAHLPSILKQRRRVQSMRTVNDRKIFRTMDAGFSFSEIRNPALTYVVSPLSRLYFQIVRNV
ncbi:MAG: glycosyltransferase family 2 protein [Parcubacteria group bacterium]|nr:glycosyltransferase family 2 protein [Parcubacteria group bacterium]